MVSFQCSPLATAGGILSTFKQCQKYQEKRDLNNFTAVCILDEVGLAEDSAKMPLKVRGRPYMTSDDFCPFSTPPPHLIRCFISAPLLIKSDLAEPPLPPYHLTSYMDGPFD